MLRCLLLCVAAFSLSGCDLTSGNSYASPSGATFNTAKCSHTSDACFQKAAATCGGPYQVIDSESHPGGTLADVLPGPVTWYGIPTSVVPPMAKCRRSHSGAALLSTRISIKTSPFTSNEYNNVRAR